MSCRLFAVLVGDVFSIIRDIPAVDVLDFVGIEVVGDALRIDERTGVYGLGLCSGTITLCHTCLSDRAQVGLSVGKCVWANATAASDVIIGLAVGLDTDEGSVVNPIGVDGRRKAHRKATRSETASRSAAFMHHVLDDSSASGCLQRWHSRGP